MSSSSMSANQTTPNPLSQGLDLAPGETREYEIDGRVVTLHGTDSGVAVLSADGNAVVVRPQPDGRFIVTGASEDVHASEPLDADGAIRLALARLDR